MREQKMGDKFNIFSSSLIYFSSYSSRIYIMNTHISSSSSLVVDLTLKDQIDLERKQKNIMSTHMKNSQMINKLRNKLVK